MNRSKPKSKSETIEKEELYLRTIVADLRNHGYDQLADILEIEMQKSFAVLRMMTQVENEMNKKSND